MRRPLFLAMLSLSLLAGSGRADQVTLKNGDRLSGTIVKTDDDTKTLLIKTEFAGEVTVQWSAVTAIQSSQPLHLTLADGRVAVGTVSTADGKLEVSTGDKGEVAAQPDAIKAVRNDKEQAEFDRLEHPRLRDYWGGLLDLGLSLTRGNSSSSALSIAGKASRAVPKNKLSLYYTQIYGKDSRQSPALTTANAIHAGLRDEFNLSSRVFVFAFTDFDSDVLENLDLRNVIGGGLGYHLVKSKNTQFDVFGGGSFNQEYFSAYTAANPAPPPDTVAIPSETRRSAEIVAGESFSTKLGPRTTFTEQLVFFPNLSSTGDYRVTFDATANTKIKSWLGWQLTLSDRYITDPPFGLKGNDLLLSTGLRLTFGRGIL
jgi:putative salt-induced outer membrane protein YdiY